MKISMKIIAIKCANANSSFLIYLFNRTHVTV